MPSTGAELQPPDVVAGALRHPAGRARTDRDSPFWAYRSQKNNKKATVPEGRGGTRSCLMHECGAIKSARWHDFRSRDEQIQEQEKSAMTNFLPDQSFYPSAQMAMQAVPEKLAYVAMLNPNPSFPAGMAVADVDPASKAYGKVIHQLDMPNAGDELHHFGWNACSSCLCPYSPHPHMERRYLIVPGLRSSRIHVLDTKPDPVSPQIVKVIEPETVMSRAGYSRPHTVHCGPEGIYVNALGSPSGDGPGGVFLMDPRSFEVRGPWEIERGPQYLAYDFAWHLGHGAMVTSEWGTPNMFEHGLDPELLLGGKYGHQLHLWDLAKRKHQQVLDLGPEQQLVFELRPARNPTKAYGFAGVVISLKDLSSSIWLWYRDGGRENARWKVRKATEIPGEPADPELLPPMLKAFGAVPPLVTDINLSL